MWLKPPDPNMASVNYRGQHCPVVDGLVEVPDEARSLLAAGFTQTGGPPPKGDSNPGTGGSTTPSGQAKQFDGGTGSGAIKPQPLKRKG